ncbi:DUF6318 family protein [Winkia neuii]|uniref:DUF6318 family protein n=1 Tax=Winkia neuii subsp. anitrata TaxID=29318 RepID=A0AB38XMZ0_9ACTO|nr:DUF6318 family protein [Winkia neuii]WCE45501.1 DUF6318 family protein [Winkia neuii subsp. anitrata]
MKHATKYLTAVAIVGALLCGGCATHADSSPKQSPTSSQSRSQKPTPKSGWEDGPPTLPIEAQRNTQEGAIAAGEYFIKTHDYAVQTGDTAPMQRAIANEGLAPKEIAHLKAKIKKIGLWVSDRASMKFVASEPRDGGVLYVQYLVHNAPQTSVDDPTKKNNGAMLDYGINFLYIDGAWKVKEYGIREAKNIGKTGQ